jgi:hypothetical protein
VAFSELRGSMDTDEKNAVRRLQDFFKAVHHWEMTTFKEDEKEKKRRESMPEKKQLAAYKLFIRSRTTELRKIYEDFCEAGAKAKRFQSGLHFGVPTTYDLKTESVVTVKKTKTGLVVKTYATTFVPKDHLYEMVAINGKWKIRDMRKYRYVSAKSWKKMEL